MCPAAHKDSRSFINCLCRWLLEEEPEWQLVTIAVVRMRDEFQFFFFFNGHGTGDGVILWDSEGTAFFYKLHNTQQMAVSTV